MRPFPEGKELVQSLNKIDILSWHFSLFYFTENTGKNSLSKKFYELLKSDIVLTFSKKAIYYTNIYLKKNNLMWPMHPKYYAIGKSTAFALQKYVKKKF